MHVGIDISSLVFGRGVSRYTRNLVSALSNYKIDLSLFGYSFKENKFLIEQAKELSSYNQRTTYNILRIPIKMIESFWKIGIFPVKRYFPKIDVFHSWDWIQPPDRDVPLVSTIHDLSILKYPETVHPDILSHHKKSWDILKSRRARLIAISRSTKQDIINYLGYPSYLVDVIYEALPEEINYMGQVISDEEYEQIKIDLRLNKPYIFFVGTREPRKNLIRLIEAWEPMNSEVQLIIAGESGWDSTSDTKKFAKLIDGGLRFLGKVSDKQLYVLYAEASLFAYPSLYEGFGLPILEAFHHGTPVLTSNNSGMLEVAGNAAELVDPMSVESIRSGLLKLLSENSKEQQIRLQRMIIRKQMFSWDIVASETIKVYKKAIEDYQ